MDQSFSGLLGLDCRRSSFDRKQAQWPLQDRLGKRKRNESALSTKAASATPKTKVEVCHHHSSKPAVLRMRFAVASVEVQRLEAAMSAMGDNNPHAIHEPNPRCSLWASGSRINKLAHSRRFPSRCFPLTVRAGSGLRWSWDSDSESDEEGRHVVRRLEAESIDTDDHPLVAQSSPPSEVLRAHEADLCGNPRASRRVVLVPQSVGGTPRSVQPEMCEEAGWPKHWASSPCQHALSTSAGCECFVALQGLDPNTGGSKALLSVTDQRTNLNTKTGQPNRSSRKTSCSEGMFTLVLGCDASQEETMRRPLLRCTPGCCSTSSTKQS